VPPTQDILVAAADDKGEWYLPLTAEQVQRRCGFEPEAKACMTAQALGADAQRCTPGKAKRTCTLDAVGAARP
jgi:hypothetical protein